MEQFLEFLTNHWALTLAFVIIVGLLLATFAMSAVQGVKQISPVDATRLINHEDAVVVDIRGEGEFKQGHILNAVHIPYEQLPKKVKKLSSYRDRPIITVCRTGQRSTSAAAALRKEGFQKVYSVKGGLVAWENANLPIVKK